MEPLKKIAFCVGIGIAVCGFGVILYAALPSMIMHSDWDNLDSLPLTEDAMLEKFQAHPTYAVFYEKFPDASEKLDYDQNQRNSSFKVGIRNFDNGIELILQMHYNTRNEVVNANIRCDVKENIVNTSHSKLYANELFVKEFIEQTNCLDLKVSGTNAEPNPPVFSGPGGTIIIEPQMRMD